MSNMSCQVRIALNDLVSFNLGELFDICSTGSIALFRLDPAATKAVHSLEAGNAC